jgi:hypothetical protein
MAKRFLYLSSVGFSQEALADESLNLGGVTMSGDIAMASNNITGLGAATSGGDLLSQAQVGASLAGLAVTADPIVMNDEKITYLGDPRVGEGADAANKQYVDNLVTAGITWREVILDPVQLVNAQGILSAMALTMTDQPHTGDTLVLTNGTTTRTYGAGTGGNVQYAIGGTLAATMQNLATAIDEDAGGAWGGLFTLNLDAIDADGVVVITELSSASALSKIYGTWTGHQAECQIVDYTGFYDYNKTATSNLPGPGAPASANFGFHHTVGNLNPGELHIVRENDCLYTWNDDASVWLCVSGPASVPDGTSASGGGTKGKLGVDSNYGLKVNSGILGIERSSVPGLYFSSGNLSVKLHGTTPGLELTSSGMRTKQDGVHGVIATATGLEVEIDDTVDTLDVDGDGLKVVGVPSLFKIAGVNTGSGVTAGNLDELTDGVSSTVLHLHPGAGGAERLEYEFKVAASVALADPVYVTASADTVGKAMAVSALDVKSWVVGIAHEAQPTPGSYVPVVMEGVAEDVLATAGDPGKIYYLDETGGLVKTNPPTGSGRRVVSIGVAINADDMLVAIRDFGKRAA